MYKLGEHGQAPWFSGSGSRDGTPNEYVAEVLTRWLGDGWLGEREGSNLPWPRSRYYRCLDKLVRLGLLATERESQTKVNQDGRPPREYFWLTEAGMKAARDTVNGINGE